MKTTSTTTTIAGSVACACDSPPGMVQWSAKSRIVNEIAKEIALVLAPLCLSLMGIHIWGEENELADALSRLYSGKDFPPALANVPRSRPIEQWLSLGT